MKIGFYEDRYLYYAWKPRGIPSTFGYEQSFLDILFELNIQTFNPKVQQAIGFLKMIFTREQEYGMLNRLDNDTAGLVYFAKNKTVYHEFKKLQEHNLIKKNYLAQVSGNFKHNNINIDFPIMHHAHFADKMAVIKTDNHLGRGRGKPHRVITSVEKLQYDESTNTSFLQVMIRKGIRHQIRIHLSSIGYPIIGDKLYNKQWDSSQELQLYSIGLEI